MEVFMIVKICIGKGFIWQQHSRAAVYDFMNNHPVAFETIVERFNLIGNSQSEVMISQRHADARALAKNLHQPGHIKLSTDIEVGILITVEEFKEIAAR